MRTNSFVTGPNLPLPSKGHCGVVRISTNEVFFSGGMANVPHKITYVYDIGNSSFRMLPGRLSTARYEHGCLMLANEEKIVAAGGVTANFKYVTTVEIFDMTTLSWSYGQKLPRRLKFAFPTISNFLVAFGYNITWSIENSYLYDESNGVWDVIGTKFNPKIIQLRYTVVNEEGMSVCRSPN